MKGWLIDTNVVAFLIAPNGAPSVKAWARDVDERRLFLSVLTFAEYDKGIAGLRSDHPDAPRHIAARDALEARFASRTLPLTNAITSFKPPTPESTAVRDAMNSVQFEFKGASYSYGNFYTGFGLTITAYLLFAAFLSWHLGTLASAHPIRTPGSFFPYATTIWSYIKAGMPANKPGSLSDDEVYAVTAYLLYRDEIVKESDVLDATSLPKVRMPNRNGFVPAVPVWPETPAQLRTSGSVPGRRD